MLCFFCTCKMYLFTTWDIWSSGLYSKCNTLLLSIPTQQRMAQEVLTHLKEHPDAWTRVDTILEFSQNMNTKVSVLWLTWHWCRGAGVAAVDIPSLSHLKEQQEHKSNSDIFEERPLGALWVVQVPFDISHTVHDLSAWVQASLGTTPLVLAVSCFPCFSEPTPGHWDTVGDSGPVALSPLRL